MAEVRLTSEVAVGKEGELFLIGGNQSVLLYILAEKPILPGIKNIFKSNLEKRFAYCGQKGIRYQHLVCPDKHSVVQESFPYPIKVEVGSSFYDYCGGQFCYPLDALRASHIPTYLKTDTHWTVEGQLIFIRELLRSIDCLEEVIDYDLEGMRKHAVDATAIRRSPSVCEAGRHSQMD